MMLASASVRLGYFRRFVTQDAVRTRGLKVEDAVGDQELTSSAYATTATINPNPSFQTIANTLWPQTQMLCLNILVLCGKSNNECEWSQINV